MSRFIRSAFFPILIVIILAIVVNLFVRGHQNGSKSSVKPAYQGVTSVAKVGGVSQTVPLSQFTADLAAGAVQKVVVDPQTMAAQVTTDCRHGRGDRQRHDCGRYRDRQLRDS